MTYIIGTIAGIVVAGFAVCAWIALHAENDRPPPGMEYGVEASGAQCAVQNDSSDWLATALSMTVLIVVMGCCAVFWAGRKGWRWIQSTTSGIDKH